MASKADLTMIIFMNFPADTTDYVKQRTFWNYCWLVRVSLFIELGCPRDLGKGWRGDLGTFKISRPI